jgi:ABC-type proline/glycine betaine transport system ATPase subunit
MIERFYNPTTGKIRVDDMTIDKLNIREFRKVIGYVG